MLTKNKYLNLHSQFYDAFVNSLSPTGSYLSYDDYSIAADRSMGPQWFIFHSMVTDITNELLNAINAYCTDLSKLESWNSVLNQCEDEYRANFIIEIIDPFVSCTLNNVPIVKQRIIYAACMLSHQTSMLLDPSIRDNSIVEHKIKLKALQRYSSIFNDVSSLVGALKQIDNQSFRDNTSNFRNLYHHRIPPNIELGLSGFINRKVNQNGSVKYGLGGSQPLRVDALIPFLHEQHQANIESFQIFWNLVTEQVSIWERKSPNTREQQH